MDTIADMLTRIRNAVRRNQRVTEMPYSKLKHEIANILVKNGYLEKSEISEFGKGRKNLVVHLSYDDGEPSITDLIRISKSGQRIYSGTKRLQRVGGKRGMILVSTSSGIMSHWEAKKRGVGGEVMCVVY